MSPDEIALMIPFVALAIPIVAIITDHQRKLAQIKASRGTTLAPDVRAELDALKNEVIGLRDTTSRFDMSFDAALTRLEERMEHVEERPQVQLSGGSGGTNGYVAAPRTTATASEQTAFIGGQS